MWDSGWDKIYQENDWGKYPDNSVVRFMARNFFNREARSAVRVLEVGCGAGANLCFLAREGFDSYGIDGSKVAIARAKQRLMDDGLQSHLKTGDIAELPYDSEFFDCVIDCECIYSNSLGDTNNILQEIHRVLKPDGKFLSMTFATETWGYGNGVSSKAEPNTFTKIEDGALHQGYGVIRFTSLDEIEAIYGGLFEVSEVEYVARSIDKMEHLIKEWVIFCTRLGGKQ
jgi:SAM-dependent methyltransferase